MGGAHELAFRMLPGDADSASLGTHFESQGCWPLHSSHVFCQPHLNHNCLLNIESTPVLIGYLAYICHCFPCARQCA